MNVSNPETVGADVKVTSAKASARERTSTTRNESPENVGKYVDLVMAAVTEQIDKPRRALRIIRVERALTPVTTTVGDQVVSGIKTVESCTRERDTEHRSDSNLDMGLNQSQSAESENEAQQTKKSDRDPR